MTAEEILDKNAIGIAAGDYTIDCGKAIACMNQYAKQECIAFAEYIIKNYY